MYQKIQAIYHLFLCLLHILSLFYTKYEIIQLWIYRFHRLKTSIFFKIDIKLKNVLYK